MYVGIYPPNCYHHIVILYVIVLIEFSIRFLAFKFSASVLLQDTCTKIRVWYWKSLFKPSYCHVFFFIMVSFFLFLIVRNSFPTTILRIKEVTAFISTARRTPIILLRTGTLTFQYVCAPCPSRGFLSMDSTFPRNEKHVQAFKYRINEKITGENNTFSGWESKALPWG